MHQHEEAGKSYYATIRNIKDINTIIKSINLGELSIGNFSLSFYEYRNSKNEQIFWY